MIILQEGPQYLSKKLCYNITYLQYNIKSLFQAFASSNTKVFWENNWKKDFCMNLLLLILRFFYPWVLRE